MSMEKIKIIKNKIQYLLYFLSKYQNYNKHTMKEFFLWYFFGVQRLSKNNLQLFSKISKQIIKNSEYLVIDVGANDGWFSRSIFRFNKNVNVISYEPLISQRSQLEDLKRKYGDRYSYEIKGLGDRCEKKVINEIETSGISSLLELNSNAYDKKYYNSKIKEQFEITLSTLDKEFLNQNINKDILLKIDTQGYELNVLKGAEKMLSQGNIKCILVELMTVEKYKGQALWLEICNFLSSYDFDLYDMFSSYYEENGKISEFDAIFLRNT